MELEEKDKELLLKKKPQDWTLVELKQFWKRHGNFDVVRTCEHLIEKMSSLSNALLLQNEKKVKVKFLGGFTKDTYTNPAIFDRPVAVGDVRELPESQAKNLLSVFPDKWKVIKDENDASPKNKIKLERS